MAKANKYRAIKTEVDGIVFASKKEAKRYVELRVMERGGLITNLVRQPRYDLTVNDTKVGTYVGDFAYLPPSGPQREIVEDVKGVKTPVYQLKKKLMKAIHHIEIVEV